MSSSVRVEQRPVVGRTGDGRGKAAWLAFCFAASVGAHGALGYWAAGIPRPRPPRSLEGFTQVFEVDPPPPAREPSLAEPPPDEKKVEREPRRAHTLRRAPSKAAPPAPASPQLAADVPGGAEQVPVDFTSTVVSGLPTGIQQGATGRRLGSGTGRGSFPAHGGRSSKGVAGESLGPDRSGGVAVLGGRAWSCPFPPEADQAGVDRAVVALSVLVGPDGHVQDLQVLNDPGHGFADAARRCALGKRYSPARDRRGRPIAGRVQLRIRFVR